MHLEIIHTKKELMNYKNSLFIPQTKKLNSEHFKKLCLECSKIPYDLCSVCLYELEKILENLESNGLGLGMPRED